MKRAIVKSLSCGLLLAICLVVNADAKPKASPEASPAAQPQKTQTMWDFHGELGLSDAQVKTLKATVGELANYLKECQQRLVSNEKQIQALLADNSDIEKIRPYLKSNADIQVEMRIADIKASQKLNSTLMPEQLSKWREIQVRSRGQPQASPKPPEPAAGEEEK